MFRSIFQAIGTAVRAVGKGLSFAYAHALRPIWGWTWEHAVEPTVRWVWPKVDAVVSSPFRLLDKLTAAPGASHDAAATQSANRSSNSADRTAQMIAEANKLLASAPKSAQPIAAPVLTQSSAASMAKMFAKAVAEGRRVPALTGLPVKQKLWIEMLALDGDAAASVNAASQETVEAVMFGRKPAMAGIPPLPTDEDVADFKRGFNIIRQSSESYAYDPEAMALEFEAPTFH